MNKFLAFISIIATALARPDGLLEGHDGHVSVTHNSLGTYKYAVNTNGYTRSEERLADGTVIGEYTAPGADGLPQTIKFRSGIDGFRILEGPLATGPVIAEVPVAPVDTALPVIEKTRSLRLAESSQVPVVDSAKTLVAASGLIVPQIGVSGKFSP